MGGGIRKGGLSYPNQYSGRFSIADRRRRRHRAAADATGVWQMAGSTFRHNPIRSCTLKYNGIFIILFMGL